MVSRMTALPLHAIPGVIDGQIRLRNLSWLAFGTQHAP